MESIVILIQAGALVFLAFQLIQMKRQVSKLEHKTGPRSSLSMGEIAWNISDNINRKEFILTVAEPPFQKYYGVVFAVHMQSGKAFMRHASQPSKSIENDSQISPPEISFSPEFVLSASHTGRAQVSWILVWFEVED